MNNKSAGFETCLLMVSLSNKNALPWLGANRVNTGGKKVGLDGCVR